MKKGPKRSLRIIWARRVAYILKKDMSPSIELLHLADLWITRYIALVGHENHDVLLYRVAYYED
jgi:hypothetical protein